MQDRSRLWRQLIDSGEYRCEAIAVINGVTYASISAPVIERGLFQESLSIGNCVSASLQISIRTEDDIPQSAEIQIKFRLVSTDDETVHTDYVPAGTFWTSRRSFDMVNKLINLTCYDAMLKTNTAYPIGDSQDWPKTERAVVNEIADLIGVELDARTIIDDSAPVIVEPRDYTVQQILGFIGVAHAGNWIITKDGKLRLIPIETAPTVQSIATEDYVSLTGVLGSLTGGREQTVTGLILTDDKDEEKSYQAGDATGYVVNCTTTLATQALCDSVFAKLRGTVYHPYAATRSVYDLASELGDPVIRLADPEAEEDDQDTEINVISRLYSETITYGFAPRGDVSAPANAELEDEFPYIGGRSGPKGEDGRSVIGQQTAYSQSTSTEVDPETLDWSTDIPDVPPGSYLWTRVTFYYSSEPLEENTYTTTLQGETGVGIASEQDYYTVTDSNVNTPDAPDEDPTIWTPDMPPTRDEGEYLWRSHKTTYTDGAVTYSVPICITGDQGDPGEPGEPGDPGVGIEEQTFYYAKNRSSVVAPGATADWDVVIPTRSYGEYVWRYQYTLYTDGSESTTTPVCITGDTGDAGLSLVINSDNGIVMQADRTVTITLTAEVQANGVDIDPDGERYVYRWWQYKDNSPKSTYLGIGKELTLVVNGRLCDVTTGVFFEIVDSPDTAIPLTTDGSLYGGRKRLARVVRNAGGDVTKIQYLTARYNWS